MDNITKIVKSFEESSWLINLLLNFLRDGMQRVALNGQTSSWADVNAGVPY